MTRIQERIRHDRRRGKSFNKPSLLDKVREWIGNAEAELGHGEYKLLEMALLLKAVEEDSDVFEELLEYATAPI